MSSVSSAEVDGEDGVGVVDDGVVLAGSEMNGIRWGGVAVESTRTVVYWKSVVSVLPSVVSLVSSRTEVSEEAVMSSWRW